MILEILKALGDATRLRLVGILARGEFTVAELTAILAMGQSRISRHLKILTEAGILDVKRQGTWAYYRLADKAPLFGELWPSLERHLDALPGRPQDLAGVARVLEERRVRSRDFFDRHARQWDALVQEVLPTVPYRQALLAAVPACERVLEIGIGTGLLLLELRRRAPAVIGVDHSPEMIAAARERLAAEGGEGVELRLGEMSHLPLSDGEVGAVVLNMVLHHAPRPETVLAEVARVLAPGGTVLIADLGRHERDWVRERLADQWLGFAPEELAAWLSASGFVGIRAEMLPAANGRLGVVLTVAERHSSNHSPSY